jgi:hypothetical protein
MRCVRVVSLAAVLTAFFSFVLAAQTPKSSSESAVFLGRIAGVYKEQFQNAFVTGEKYPSEDVLEVVPVSNDAAYVRMDLEFSNGHSGQIYGIATYGRNTLIYDNGKAGDEHCVVEYVWSSDMVVTKADYEKTPGCSFYHGAHGSLEGAKFSVKKRRDIGYMQRLKNSKEFKEAIEEYSRLRKR